MKKNISIIVTIVVIIALLGIISVVVVKKNKIDELQAESYNEVVSKEEFSLTYVGTSDDPIIKLLRSIRDDYKIYVNILDVEAEVANEVMDTDIIESVPAFVLLENGKISYAMDAVNTSQEEFTEQIEKMLYGTIPKSERYFVEFSKLSNYKELVNSKDVTVAVFGTETCNYCTLYLPVINEVAKEYDQVIYYINRDDYSDTEYQDIMNLDLEIPGECTMDGNDTTMIKGFPKPMTLITKNGKTIGCIKGYVTKDVLVSKLEELNILKEK